MLPIFCPGNSYMRKASVLCHPLQHSSKGLGGLTARARTLATFRQPTSLGEKLRSASLFLPHHPSYGGPAMAETDPVLSKIGNFGFLQARAIGIVQAVGIFNAWQMLVSHFSISSISISADICSMISHKHLTHITVEC